MSEAYDNHMRMCKLFGLRMKWMSMLGFDDDEIKDSLKKDTPTSVTEEQAELDTVKRMSKCRLR
jgi:hypothetical protein